MTNITNSRAIDISVIICTYNRCESLKQTLNSLFAQKDINQFTYEIIVVDNNSKDNTKEVAESYKQHFNGRLQYMFEPRQGKSYALNSAITKARGEILAFTDDDAIVDSHWISSIIEVFQRTGCMAIAGKIIPVYPSELPRWIVQEGPHSASLDGIFCFFDRGNEERECRGIEDLPYGANMAFRKIAFEKYGLFKTTLGRNKKLTTGEDIEFAYRLFKNKERMVYAPNIIVNHMVDEKRLRKDYFRKWYFYSGLSHAQIAPDLERFEYWFGVPRYLLRQLVSNSVAWLSWILRFNGRIAFSKELKIRRILGQMCGYRKLGTVKNV